MLDLLVTGTSAGVGGILGALVSWLGLKPRLKDVRYVDTCNEICKATEQRLQSMETRQSEMCQDIKLILSKLS